MNAFLSGLFNIALAFLALVAFVFLLGALFQTGIGTLVAIPLLGAAIYWTFGWGAISFCVFVGGMLLYMDGKSSVDHGDEKARDAGVSRIVVAVILCCASMAFGIYDSLR